MTGRLALASGLTLNTRVDGPQDGPWLILSNSLGANISMWDPQIDFLTQGYRVLRYDARGHGASDTPLGPYSFEDLTGDVIALMDAMQIQTAGFMGLSMGGMTGLGLSIHAPDRISRVVCADGRADAPEPFRAMWDQRIGLVEAGGLEAIADGTLATWLTEDWRAAHPQETAAVRDMITGTDPAGYVACCRALQGLDYLRHLGTAKVPVLFVGGSEDKGAAPDVMQAMADATPGGVFIELPGAAHVANINDPNGFNAATKDFLSL